MMFTIIMRQTIVTMSFVKAVLKLTGIKRLGPTSPISVTGHCTLYIKRKTFEKCDSSLHIV